MSPRRPTRGRPLPLPWLRANWDAVLSYGVPAALLLAIAAMLALGVAFGDPPAPQIPPEGYRAYEPTIALEWRPGDRGRSFHLQVARDGDFRAPIFEKETTQTRIVMPRPEPGRYCWRVVEDDGAQTSCFVVPDNPGAL